MELLKVLLSAISMLVAFIGCYLIFGLLYDCHSEYRYNQRRLRIWRNGFHINEFGEVVEHCEDKHD